MIRANAVAIMALAGPAAADPWIDYELVMEQNADRVVTETLADGTLLRTLDLDDGTRIRCTPDRCFGVNDSGAPACLLEMIASTYVMAQACPWSFATGNPSDLARRIEALGRHIAANAVPPRDWAVEGPVYMARIRERYDRPGVCDISAGHRFFLDHLASPAMDATIAAMTATPRLPVWNPCL